MSPRITRFLSVMFMIVFLMLAALAAHPRFASAQNLARKGSFGASLGLMKMTADADTKEQSSMRGMGDVRFAYLFSNRFAFTTTAGFGWTGYPVSKDQIVTQLPLVFGVELRPFGKTTHVGSVVPRIGLGVGYYSWVVETRNGRNVKKYPPIWAPLRASDPGGFGEVGAEYFASPSVGVTGSFLYHYIKSGNLTKYPTAFGGNDAFIQIRIGANYYFSMDRIKRKPEVKQ